MHLRVCILRGSSNVNLGAGICGLELDGLDAWSSTSSTLLSKYFATFLDPCVRILPVVLENLECRMSRVTDAIFDFSIIKEVLVTWDILS